MPGRGRWGRGLGLVWVAEAVLLPRPHDTACPSSPPGQAGSEGMGQLGNSPRVCLTSLVARVGRVDGAPSASPRRLSPGGFSFF